MGEHCISPECVGEHPHHVPRIVTKPYAAVPRLCEMSVTVREEMRESKCLVAISVERNEDAPFSCTYPAVCEVVLVAAEPKQPLLNLCFTASPAIHLRRRRTKYFNFSQLWIANADYCMCRPRDFQIICARRTHTHTHHTFHVESSLLAKLSRVKLYLIWVDDKEGTFVGTKLHWQVCCNSRQVFLAPDVPHCATTRTAAGAAAIQCRHI